MAGAHRRNCPSSDPTPDRTLAQNGSGPALIAPPQPCLAVQGVGHAGKAAMLVLLAAIDEGLAAGVFGVPAEAMELFRELLGIPRDVAVVEVITIGRPAEDRVSDERSSRATRPRKPLEELVRWERWE